MAVVVISIAEFRSLMGAAFASSTVYTDAIVQQYLDFAKIGISQSTFRDYYKWAVYFLAAHYIYLRGESDRLSKLASNNGAASQPVGQISETGIGDLSKRVDFPEWGGAQDAKFLQATAWGQQFLALRRKMCRGAIGIMPSSSMLSIQMEFQGYPYWQGCPPVI